MSDPFLFDITSPRFGLPLLFPGQAQKEAFVNEALALADALLHCAVEGTRSDPPATPAEGENWIVGASPTGAWIGQEGTIACRQGGNWLFVAPVDGLRLLDRATGQERRFHAGWHAATVPALPTGGTTIDAEARNAIAGIVAALRAGGLLPPE